MYLPLYTCLPLPVVHLWDEEIRTPGRDIRHHPVVLWGIRFPSPFIYFGPRFCCFYQTKRVREGMGVGLYSMRVRILSFWLCLGRFLFLSRYHVNEYGSRLYRPDLKTRVLTRTFCPIVDSPVILLREFSPPGVLSLFGVGRELVISGGNRDTFSEGKHHVSYGKGFSSDQFLIPSIRCRLFSVEVQM